jgi:hypothetical protein
MSVKLVDREAGERLYQYITGKLDALPPDLRDRDKLAKALLYIQRTYGLTPQQVKTRLLERKNFATSWNSATSRSLAEIGGKALERLADVLKTFYYKYGVSYPTLRLTDIGISVTGLSDDREMAVSTVLGFRAGEGYVAPKGEYIVDIDTSSFLGEDSLEKIIVRGDGNWVMTKSGEIRKIGDILEPERAFKIEGLEGWMETKDNRLDVEARPEVIEAVRKLLDSYVEPQLIFVKENGKPAMYIGVFDRSSYGRYILRVPDALITKAYVDPNAPDGALAHFSHSINKRRLPEVSENVRFTTKVFPKGSGKVFPLRLATRESNGVLFSVYYAPSDPEQAFFSPPKAPIVTYPVNDDIVANAVTDMAIIAYDIYILPEKDKIYFAGTNYNRKNIIYLVEINTPSKTVDQSILGNVFKIINPINYGTFTQKAIKAVKTLGLQPTIGISGDELSLFGVTTPIKKTENEKARNIREKIEKFKELPEKYTYVSLTGKDLVDILEKFNEQRRSEGHYLGNDILRIIAKQGGVAELEAYRDYGNERKTVWRKEIKFANSPNTPLDLKLYIENLAGSGKFPLITLTPHGFYNTKGLASLLKNAIFDIFFQPNGLPLATRIRAGNVVIYRILE